MATSSVTNTTTTTATTSKATIANNKLADDFDQFLTLLTTQLQNQNPLDPLDTNQFTQQLVQFAGVEQPLGLAAQADDDRRLLWWQRCD